MRKMKPGQAGVQNFRLSSGQGRKQTIDFTTAIAEE